MVTTGERIAIVTTSYPRGPGDAAGHFVETEARALARAGNHVTVITPRGEASTIARGDGAAAVASEERPGSLLVLRLPDGGASGLPGILPRLRERPARAIGIARWVASASLALARRAPFERVQAHWLFPAAFPIAILATRDTPLEVVLHGSDARLLAMLPVRTARWILQALIRRRAVFRCVSEELAELLRSLAPPGTHPEIRVSAALLSLNGVPCREDARRKLGVPPDERLVVVVGRLIASKRVRDALAAARLVPDSHVVVVGGGPEQPTLQRDFPEAHFTGQTAREQALTWIAAADVVLSASRTEGAPTALREARALGVPVVTSAAGDLLRWAELDSGLYVVR